MRDAALVLEDSEVVAIEAAGAAADERVDAGGRCVIPGFVDSHTHLVFAGERGEEFAARMAGAPYAAGGIRETVTQTRAASIEELQRAASGAAPGGAARPGSPTSRSSLATRSTSRASGGCASWRRG